MTQQELQPAEGPFILTDLARQRLDQRITAAGSNIDSVDAEISAELAELDSITVPEEGSERVRIQAERAHLQAQRNYLNKVRLAQGT